MRGDRKNGIPASPVRFLIRCITESKAYPPPVKRHILQAMRPYTHVYNVPFEQVAAAAVFLNAYAQWAKWSYALTQCDGVSTKDRQREGVISTRVNQWSHTLSKCPASKGMVSRQTTEARRLAAREVRSRQLPPTRSAESVAVAGAPQRTGEACQVS